MPTLSPDIIRLLSIFTIAVTGPTLAKMGVLLQGTLLSSGRRVMGLSESQQFSKYHQVFNRAKWSPWLVSQLLLELIIATCLSPEAVLVLGIDDTLERRQGPQIKYKGWFRDPLRSTAKKVSTSLGLRWLCVAVLTVVPWSRRRWALPFILIPTLSPATSRKLGKQHRTLLGWAEYVVVKIRRWQPDRSIALVGDGAFATMPLLQRCQRKHIRVTLVARLRFDAVWHQPAGQRGPKPKKGARLPNPQAYLDDPNTIWTQHDLWWYGGQRQRVEIATGQCLWYRRGLDPAPIRWVLVRCPSDEPFRPFPLLCADPQLPAAQIVEWFVMRWNIEVTFQEIRAQLGFETQRQWSDKAIERTAKLHISRAWCSYILSHRLSRVQLQDGSSDGLGFGHGQLANGLLDQGNGRPAHAKLVQAQSQQDRCGQGIAGKLAAQPDPDAGGVRGFDGLVDQPQDTRMERVSQGRDTSIRPVGGGGILG